MSKTQNPELSVGLFREAQFALDNRFVLVGLETSVCSNLSTCIYIQAHIQSMFLDPRRFYSLLSALLGLVPGYCNWLRRA
jgi:hypothetical protein